MSPPLHPAGPFGRESGHHRSRMVERQTVLVAIMGGEPVMAGDGPHDDPRAVGATGHAGRWTASRISDISQDACALSSPLPLARGMAVRIMLPGFEGRLAHVVAVADGTARCAFSMPLPTAILDYIVRMSDPAARG